MNQSLIPANPTDMMSVAKNLAESGYFQDAKAASQAFVKVLAGAELGLPPFQAMSGIHVISGKPVLGAGLIASIIKRSGKYDYRVRETSETVCSIEFFQGADSIGTSTFTLEQAKKAQVKNLDKFAQNMLFARAISNGAKWFTPDVFGGPVYTDGEIEPMPYAVQETTATVVHEAVPVAATPASEIVDPEVLRQMDIWTDNIDVLYNDETRRDNPDSWDVSFTALSSIANLPAKEKNKQFLALKNFASEFGIEWDKDTKKFKQTTEEAA